MEESGLSSFLEDLGAPARTDSHGAFSLDPERALENLKRYRLKNPYLYVLNLVASAVAGGARTVELECDRRELVLTSDGRPFTASELQNLFSSLFVGAPTSVQELAIGLHAALGLGPEEVTVQSWAAGQGVRMVVEDEQPVCSELGSVPSGRGNRVSVLHGRLTRARRVLHSTQPETECFRARCGYGSEVEMRGDGELLVQTWDLQPADALIELRPVPGPWRPPLHYRCAQDIPCRNLAAPFSAVLGLNEPHQPELMLALLNGVSFPLTVDFGYGATGLVQDDRFTKDLSQQNLVDTPRYRSILERLRREADATVVELANRAGQRGHEPRGADRRALRRLEKLGLRYLREGDTERTQTLARQSLDLRQMTGTLDEADRELLQAAGIES